MNEPTQGLDPESAREFLNMVGSLKNDGATVLLCSHLLHQVQAVCDRVGLFHRGQMVLEGTVQQLAQRVLGGAYQIYLEADGPVSAITEVLRCLPGAMNVRHLDTIGYEVKAERDLREEAARAVIAANGKLLKLDLEAQTLDEIYSRYFEGVEHAVEG
jgi:ABC-2 type transport system ATP-binding protein